jgi:hypothetical protein
MEPKALPASPVDQAIFLRLVLRLTVMPRCWHGGTGRFGDENWADQIGEHSAGGPVDCGLP